MRDPTSRDWHTARRPRRRRPKISTSDKVRSTSTQQLLGVYDADGGLVGQARYVVGHLLGTAECALCAITQAPLRRTPEWDRMVAGLELPLAVVHRNQVPFWARAAVDAVPLPVILARTVDGHVIDLLGPTELEACGGSVSTFRDLLDEALRRLG
ncbi:MAG: hypothetical protein ACNA8R_06035 [Nitriliruptoraceae bacterium]